MGGGMADISPNDVDVVIYNKKEKLYVESILIKVVKKTAKSKIYTTADVDRAMTFMFVSGAKGVINRHNLKGYEAYYYDKNQEIIYKP